MLSIKRTHVVAALLAGLMIVAGCENSAESGTLIGAGGGALAGQAIGHNTTGTLVGAGVGALGGYIIGNEMDKKAKSQDVTAPQQSTYSSSNGAAAVTTPSNTPGNNYSSGDVAATITIRNANGSTTPVTVHKQGTDWVGPKGEHYDHLPTEAELRPIYGL